MLFFISWKTFAYTTDDFFNIYYQWNNSRQTIYNVPEWKDLIINFLYTDDITNSTIFIRDNWSDVLGWQFTENKNDVFFVIKDNFEIIDWISTNNYVFTWLLINEWEDINHIINKTEYGINKPIFNEEFIKEIYLYEGVIMLFLLLFKFFARLLWRPKTRAGL